MSREHFAVGVDVDSFSFRLLKQNLQIPQVVAGNDNEGPFLHSQGYGGGDRVAVGFGVGLVQQGHALKVHFANLHDHWQQLLHTPVLTNGEQTFVEEVVYFFIGVAKHHGVIGVCRHAPQTEQNQRFEGTDVLVILPEPVHVILLRSSAGRGAGTASGNQGGLFPAHSFDLPQDGFLVEIDIGQGGEQPLDYSPVGGSGGGIGVGGPGKANQGSGELIL